jgi:hypothetical protein
MSSTFTDVMFYNVTDALSFSFPFPLSQVPLLQTCFKFEFVYDHVCFLYMFAFLDLFSMYEEKHTHLSF